MGAENNIIIIHLQVKYLLFRENTHIVYIFHRRSLV